MTEYTELEFIDDNFPWRKYTENELYREYNKLKDRVTNDKIVFPILFCHIGYKCTDNFFQRERLSTRSDTNMSCVDFWDSRKEKILEYHKNQRCKKDLFGTIVYIKRAPSHFSPYTAAMIYRHFNASNVLDPYAGWGDRCLAAMALDINYTGVDCNINLRRGYKNMIRFFPHSGRVKFLNERSENIPSDDSNYDLIFTSPPFWNNKNQNLLENYYGCETDYQTFLDSSLFPLFIKYLGKVSIALYITKNMYESIKDKFGPSRHQIQFKSSTAVKNKNYTFHTIYCW